MNGNLGAAPGADKQKIRRQPPDRILTTDVRRVATLTPGDRDAMWELYSRCYDGTSAHRFSSDLDGKDFVFLLHDEARRLQGFSTVAIWSREFDGRPIRVMYSGDTIIDREHWGTQALAFYWLRFAGRQKQLDPDVPLYWFLIVKGQRTYRYLPTFARAFIPDWRQPPSTRLKRLLDQLATERFGAAYSAATGVVHFRHSHGHLAPELATISERESAREDVQLFLSSNPGFREGDELACLCELAEDNLRPLARRIFCDGKTQ